MIDIHCHVLYDIDDGSEDIETSIELCRDAHENGCEALVLTPHFFDFKSLNYFVEERDEKIDNLRDALKEEGIPLKLYAGAEIFLSDRIFNADNLDDLTLNDTRYILCEMPLGPFDTRHVSLWFDELLDRGYSPILAHPERYFEFHKDYSLIDDLLDKGIIFQVNIDSLTGKNGEAPQDMAVDMVRRGIAQLMASDAHDRRYRHTRLKEKLEEFPEKITEEHIKKCLETNPRHILKNEDI